MNQRDTSDVHLCFRSQSQPHTSPTTDSYENKSIASAFPVGSITKDTPKDITSSPGNVKKEKDTPRISASREGDEA